MLQDVCNTLLNRLVRSAFAFALASLTDDCLCAVTAEPLEACEARAHAAIRTNVASHCSTMMRQKAAGQNANSTVYYCL